MSDLTSRIVQYVHRCLNGYGVSVIRDRSRFEVAVIWFTGPGDNEFDLVYDTPITGDVLPGQTAEEVAEIIERVARLPRRPRALEG